MTFSAAPSRYENMLYRRVGRSGLTLPALSLGLWHNFGRTKPFETQQAIVRRAFDLGITHFDLANNYGPPHGSAEENFGRLVKADLGPYRDEIIVSTKAGYGMWDGPYGDFGSRKSLLASLDQSLGRLDLDYVDIFYSHRPDPDTPIEETMGSLASAVQQGKALYVGVSNYSPEQTLAAQAALAEHKVPLLIHQPRYSLLDRRPEDGLLDTVRDAGIGAIVFSPLEQGLLTDRYLHGTIPPTSRAAVGHFLSPNAVQDDYLKMARRLNELAGARGQTLAQLALTWVLRSTAVTSAIIGASSVAQLEQNVPAATAAGLTLSELRDIDGIIAEATNA